MAKDNQRGDVDEVDIEDYLEQEVLLAPKRQTNHLFHYTNANAAIAGILRSGDFRLAPFDGTNDLWESRPLYPSVAIHADNRGSEPDMELWQLIDTHLRRHAKVGCFTQDWELPEHVADRDALRGWAHLSLWAHYGERHAGVCLRFDRERLVAALERSAGTGPHWAGEVRYTRTSLGPLHPIDLGQVNEFGVDAVALAFAVLNHDMVFFRKHADWETESEYRLVLLGNSVAPAYIDVREALTGVVLGEGFPHHSMPELQDELERYPQVELFRLGYLNRRLYCTPSPTNSPPQSAPTEPSISHRRPGNANQRAAALLDANTETLASRAAGAAIAKEHHFEVERAMSSLIADIATWGDIDARLHRSITAVPEELRARAAGVPGEVVHYEQGLMCVGENLPRHSHTFVVAAAIQVLASGAFRLHSLVSTERWDPNGSTTTEHWRDQRDTGAENTKTELHALLSDLQSAALRTRPQFDKQRS